MSMIKKFFLLCSIHLVASQLKLPLIVSLIAPICHWWLAFVSWSYVSTWWYWCWYSTISSRRELSEIVTHYKAYSTPSYRWFHRGLGWCCESLWKHLLAVLRFVLITATFDQKALVLWPLYTRTTASPEACKLEGVSNKEQVINLLLLRFTIWFAISLTLFWLVDSSSSFILCFQLG